MNQIEQLGGYEKAKAEHEARKRSGIHACELERALLQHRREHGAYEVGDDIVLIGSCSAWSDRVEKIQEFRREMVITLGFNYVLRSDVIRHADDAEIKANKRLEVGL